jgi:DNA-binding NarL/FixJ family response regulator
MCSNPKARLPDMSGIDVMKEIKDITPSVLAIIVTAYGDEEVRSMHSEATPAIILRSHSAEPSIAQKEHPSRTR